MGGIGAIVGSSGEGAGWRSADALAGPASRGETAGIRVSRLALAIRSRGQEACLHEGRRWVVALHGFLSERAGPHGAGPSGRSTGRPAAERVAELLEVRGAAGLLSLRGEHAIVAWDKHCSALLLYRDLVGTKPLAFRRRGAHLYLASEVRSLLDDGEAEALLDDTYLASWVANEPTGERTPFIGVSRVHPGAVWRVDGEAASPSLRLVEEWTPPSRIRSRGRGKASEVADRVRETLCTAVADRLSSQGRSVVSLSGGLDSGSIWSIASRLLRPERDRLGAVAVRFPGYRCDEGHVIELHRARSAHDVSMVDGTVAATRETFLQVAAAVDVPVAHTTVFQALVFREAGRLAADTVLTGLGGDQWFGASTGFIRELAAEGRVVEAGLWSLRLLLRGHVPPRAVAGAMLTVAGHGRARRGNAGPQQEHGGPQSPARRSTIGLRLQIERSGWYMEPVEQLAERAGIEVRHPFMDQDLIDQVMSVPESALWNGTAPKGLLRQAISSIADRDFLAGAGKTDFDDQLEVSLSQDARARKTSQGRSGDLWTDAVSAFRDTNSGRNAVTIPIEMVPSFSDTRGKRLEA